jgi:hypothetical protein
MLLYMLPWLCHLGGGAEPAGSYTPWDTDDSDRQADPEAAGAHDNEPAIASGLNAPLYWLDGLSSAERG